MSNTHNAETTTKTRRVKVVDFDAYTEADLTNPDGSFNCNFSLPMKWEDAPVDNWVCVGSVSLSEFDAMAADVELCYKRYDEYTHSWDHTVRASEKYIMVEHVVDTWIWHNTPSNWDEVHQMFPMPSDNT